MDYFEQQDIFIAKMKEDYEKGGISIKALAPYFRWKFDDKAKDPSRSQIWKMYLLLNSPVFSETTYRP